MNKQTRFYFFTKTSVILIVSFFLSKFIFDLIKTYTYGLHDISDEVIDVLSVLITVYRSLSMTAFILIMLYFVYIAFRYLTSKFYLASRIPLHEAFFHGYLDLAYAYDRISKYHKTDYDTKYGALIVYRDNNVYHILVREYFGTIQGEAKSSNWYICSKKKKEYGRIQYKKRIPILNPIEENKVPIEKFREQHGIVCINLVCITGLQRNVFKDERINTVYEIESLIK